MTEKSNLLLDYIGKFINQTAASAHPAVKLTKSRSIISHECQKMNIDAEDCVPYINYLGNKKRYQFSRLTKALELITNYFIIAKRRCDNVLSKSRCRKLIVSRLCLIL